MVRHGWVGPEVPEFQNPAIRDAALTSTTWYDVLTTKNNVLVHIISFLQDTANEDIELRITTEEGTDTLTQTAVAGTTYYVALNDASDSAVPFKITTTETVLNLPLEQVKIEIRKTSAAGANNTAGRVLYSQW